jgi:hypothetical protein
MPASRATAGVELAQVDQTLLLPATPNTNSLPFPLKYRKALGLSRNFSRDGAKRGMEKILLLSA